jgi:hypothetical protein
MCCIVLWDLTAHLKVVFKRDAERMHVSSYTVVHSLQLVLTCCRAACCCPAAQKSSSSRCCWGTGWRS